MNYKTPAISLVGNLVINIYTIGKLQLKLLQRYINKVVLVNKSCQTMMLPKVRLKTVL